MAHFVHSHSRSFTEKPGGIALIATLAAAVGAVAAVLITPKRGSEMRSSIADKLRGTKDKTAEHVDTAKTAAADVASSAKESVDKTADKVRHLGNKASDRVNQAADATKEKSEAVASQTRRHVNR